MKKILLTNNSKLIDENYDEVYTDSPYVVEKYSKAIYLDTLLDKNLDVTIQKIQIKGYELNNHLINIFFPNYKNRNFNILNIKVEFTNTFINIVKLFKLIDLYPNDQITIGVMQSELYDYNSSNTLDRFVNVYYWVAELAKIKNIKLLCKVINSDLSIKHLPIDSWFLRLIDLDKKVLIFNFLKKINLINKKKNKKIYKYKDSNVLREIEPYLYDLGFNLVDMPEINFNFKNNDDFIINKKLKDILDDFFENDFLNDVFKKVLFEMYGKRIKYYKQKIIYSKEYISNLDKSIKIIITNTITGFDSNIFAKQLQQSGYKIINVRHGLSTSFRRKKDLEYIECEAPDVTLCFNSSEKKMFKDLIPDAILHPISVVQEAKKKRLRFLKRFYVNKMLNMNDTVNIFYPSNIYPYNNVSIYGFRQSDKFNYNFEKKMISLLSGLNKKVIYKNYPIKSYVDSNPLIKFAQSFSNIKVIDGKFDFRYVSSLGDIFILGSIGSSSTITWMLGENKPIIFLYTNKFRFINEEGKKILDKILIVVNIDENNWVDTLRSILNKPYEELIEIWRDKQKYRDQYDEEWLMGINLHAGKLGAKYTNDLYLKTLNIKRE
tara:strand:+ start:3785 stop:5596 length:1812 start_codon:yes stop_codon:yes gene_type:complete